MFFLSHPVCDLSFSLVKPPPFSFTSTRAFDYGWLICSWVPIFFFFSFFLPPYFYLGFFIMKRIYGKRAREIRFQWSPLFLFLFSNWKFLLFCFRGEMFSHEQKTRINTTHSLVFIFSLSFIFLFSLYFIRQNIKSNLGSFIIPEVYFSQFRKWK